MDDAKISVIIPIYRAEAYLRRCVDSVRDQTHHNLEIILVDDGSPDSCGAMCDAFAAEDERIRVIHQENGGMSAARNAGLDIATGDYIGFVDADDWVEPEMYAALLELMLRCDADVACCGVAHCHPDGDADCSDPDWDGDILCLNRAEALRTLLSNYRITNSVWDKLFRRALFDGLRLRAGLAYEDAEVMPRLLDRAARVVYMGRPLYVNFMSPGSVTRSPVSLRTFDLVDVYRERVDFYREHCPECVAVAKSNYVGCAVAILDLSRSARQLAGARAERYRQVMDFVRDNPGLEWEAQLRRSLRLMRLGLPAYDFIRRAQRGVARRWKRLKRRIARPRPSGERQTPAT